VIENIEISLGDIVLSSVIMDRFLEWMVNDPEWGMVSMHNHLVIQTIGNLLRRKVAGEEISSDEWLNAGVWAGHAGDDERESVIDAKILFAGQMIACMQVDGVTGSRINNVAEKLASVFDSDFRKAQTHKLIQLCGGIFE
jgi:hypothetical protein